MIATHPPLRVRQSRPEKHLVGEWLPSRNRHREVWRDSSPFHNHGTVTNMTPEANARPSRFGWAWQFPDDGYMNLGQRDEFDQPQFTLMLLAAKDNPAAATDSGVFRGLAWGAGTTFSYGIGFSLGVGRGWVSDNLNAVTSAGLVAIVDSQWYLWALTYDGTHVELWRDGVGNGPVAAGAIDYTKTHNDLIVGSRTTGIYGFGGQIAMVRLYSRAFTAPDFRRVMRSLRREPRALAGLLSRSRATTTRTLFFRRHAMALSFENDYKYIDGKIDIRLDDNVVRNCIMFQSAIKEGDASKGAYLHRETRFQLPSVPAIATPEVGQTVVAAGISYTVLKVREPYLGDYWGLTTREVSITADTDLQNQVTLYPAVHTLQPGGWSKTRHPSAHATFVDVPAKVQIQTSRSEDKAAKRGFKKVYHIFVSEELPTLAHGDLIKDENSKQYTIDSWKNRERIDEYSVVICSTPPGS